MKYQATRNGQFVGKPQKIKEDAQAVIERDKKIHKRCADDGYITQKSYNATRWNICRV